MKINNDNNRLIQTSESGENPEHLARAPEEQKTSSFVHSFVHWLSSSRLITFFIACKNYLTNSISPNSTRRMSIAERCVEEVAPDTLVNESGVNESGHKANKTAGRVSEEALAFFESFPEKYFSAPYRQDFEKGAGLLAQLKEIFPDYFERHPASKNALILDKEEVMKVRSGIVNFYRLAEQKSEGFMLDNGYHRKPTIDDGDCLFDAIWNGLSDDIRRQVKGRTGNDGYLSLRTLVEQKADSYRDLIIKNKYNTSYDIADLKAGAETDIKQSEDEVFNKYKALFADKTAIWPRYYVEGVMLAKELNFNLVLIGGVGYEEGLNETGMFITKDDMLAHKAGPGRPTVYIENIKSHFMGVDKV